MKKSIATAAVLCLAPLSFPVAANAATIVGDMVTCSTNTHPSSRCNGAATAAVPVIDDVSMPEFRIFATPNFDPLFTVDFGNGFLTLKSFGNRRISSTILTFTNQAKAWASIEGGGALAGRATIVDGNIRLNLANRDYSTGESFTFITTSVPEPGTWMLMILGLGAVGFSMRRRQTASVRYQFA